MWKRFCFLVTLVCTPVLSKFSPQNVIEKIFERLGANLDYILEHYDKINVDCLFGVVLANAILDDTVNLPGPYREKSKAMRAKTGQIYAKSLPIMQKQAQWNYFAKHVVIPDLWIKPIKYKLAEFRMAYAMKSRVEALYSEKTYENYTEGFSDQCLSSVVNSTLDLKPKTICRLDPKCEDFIETLDKGSGYILTHKLLLLQVARVRKCKMHPKILANAIKKVCASIYTETISVEYFVGLDEILDLFLEQSLLCGYEGYADFLKIQWLDTIFAGQHKTGCFSVKYTKRKKREANVWADGCVDHTTGLGAAIFSLYLNYIIKNIDTIVLTSEWL